MHRSVIAATAALLLVLAAAATAAPATAAAGNVHVLVALKERNLEVIERLLLERSNPRHASYGQWMSGKEIARIVSPPAREVRAVLQQLRKAGATNVQHRASGSYITAEMPQTLFDSMRASRFHPLIDFVTLRKRETSQMDFDAQRGTPKWLKAPANGPIASPNTQKAAYGIPVDLAVNSSDCLQMVWGTGTYGYLASDLQDFYTTQHVNADVNNIEAQGDAGTPGGDNFGEATLDVSYISTLGLGCRTAVTNSDNASDTEWSTGFGPAELAFMESLSSADVVPQVLSLSLGSLSFAACDMLCRSVANQGKFTYEQCSSYTSSQRQVCMFNSFDEMNRTNTEFMKIGLRGVTIVAASGDGGSHFSFQEFDPNSEMGQELNTASCGHSVPTFPSASPWVTSVGGVSLNLDLKKPSPWTASGGGFSWQFGTPDYQQDALAAYYSQTQLPPSDSFNRNGRGYPDVAAASSNVPMVVDGRRVMAGGTSASTPSFGGIVTLLNDIRKSAGLPTLGFLNPRLYQTMAEHQAEVFVDMPEGTSACTSGTFCCPKETSFNAAPGWDPITGFGMPIWSGLVKYFTVDQ